MIKLPPYKKSRDKMFRDKTSHRQNDLRKKGHMGQNAERPTQFEKSSKRQCQKVPLSIT